MDEYISREAAKAAIMGVPEGNWSNVRYIKGLDAVPAADVVTRDCFDRLLEENDRLRAERPVVRCSDCKHYDCEDGDQKCVKDAEWDEEGACYYGFISYHGPEFYCADGERR